MYVTRDWVGAKTRGTGELPLPDEVETVVMPPEEDPDPLCAPATAIPAAAIAIEHQKSCFLPETNMMNTPRRSSYPLDTVWSDEPTRTWTRNQADRPANLPRVPKNALRACLPGSSGPPAPDNRGYNGVPGSRAVSPPNQR